MLLTKYEQVYRQYVEAARDSEWLCGESHWFPNHDSAPKHIKGEVEPPSSWSPTTAQKGSRGWIRQRLSPLGPMILYTTAWAPFFLIASSFPLAFPGRTPDDQNVALALFLISWLLLIVPFSRLRDGLVNRARSGFFDMYPFETSMILLGTVVFFLHVLISPLVGWLAYLIFGFAQYRTISNITECVGHNSARWLLPINRKDIAEDILGDGWERDSKTFRNGPIAHWGFPLPGYAATLVGVTRGKDSFIAFTLKHRGGTLHDPFSEEIASDERFSSIIEKPPVNISGEMWPTRFLNMDEEE